MIAIRVKAAAAVAVVALVACSGRPAGSAVQAPSAPSIPTGAERWEDGALLLPADSPVVFTARLDLLLTAAAHIKAWLVAEPAMLGPDGPEIARTIENGWIAATAYLGVDPLLESAWTERGIDPKRRIYVGMYPVLDDGRRFVSNVDTVLREELGLAPGGSVSAALHQLAAAGGELPEGTNAKILRTLTQTDPIGGMRVVIGTSSHEEFLITASSFAEGMGFRPFPASVGAREHTFWSEGDTVPAISIRFAGDHAVLDLLFPAFVGGARKAFDPKKDLPRLHAELIRALGQLPPGRPDAPAPEGDPMVSLSFHQAATATQVRLRNYWQSLEALQSTGTDKRDAELLPALVAAVAEADAWTVADDELTGTSFQVNVAPPDSKLVGNVQMTLFARRGLKLLDTSREVPTLDLSRRSMAFGVDLGQLRGEDWRSWFVGETAAEFDALEFQSMRPFPTLLPGLRAGTLAVSTFGDHHSTSTVSSDLGATLGDMKDIQRVEIVGLAPDVDNIERSPELLCAVLLPAGASPDAVARVQAVLAGVLVGWTSLDAEPPAFRPLTAGMTSTVPFGAIPIRQHLIRGTEHVVVLFGIGVTEAAFLSEIDGLRSARRIDGAAQGRIEPIALLSWLRDGDAELFDPIDVDILAQRLGALTLRYAASPLDESSAITVELQLEAPPRL